MKISKSALFLFELMIVILIFTFAAAICTEIFANSLRMSRESRGLTMSSVNAQTVAEEFKASDSAAAPPPLYFDEDWTAAEDGESAFYTVVLEDNGSTPQMKDAFVNVYQGGAEEPIYSLHVKAFAAEFAG
jgi:Tfp pilus assembly protein PilE